MNLQMMFVEFQEIPERQDGRETIPEEFASVLRTDWDNDWHTATVFRHGASKAEIVAGLHRLIRQLEGCEEEVPDANPEDRVAPRPQ